MKNKQQTPTEEKEFTIDMPEVKDIPGQEHVKPPKMREMADTTISSAGEEGEGLLDDLNEEDTAGDEGNLTPTEKNLLAKTDRPETEETKDLEMLALDPIDDEDVPNEKSDPLDLGSDLDVPGSELDDDDEDLGEEDEENNSYSEPD